MHTHTHTRAYIALSHTIILDQHVRVRRILCAILKYISHSLSFALGRSFARSLCECMLFAPHWRWTKKTYFARIVSIVCCYEMSAHFIVIELYVHCGTLHGRVLDTQTHSHTHTCENRRSTRTKCKKI